MIDYYVTNGETGRYKEIEELENRDFDTSGAPSPDDIKYQKKMEFIPRTIRINEFADAAIRVLADECEMSYNKVVDAIFESYVNKFRDRIGGNELMREHVINNYLDRVDNELTDEVLSRDKKKWERAIRNEYGIVEDDKYGVLYETHFSRPFFSAVIFKPKEGVEEARFEKVDENDWQIEGYCGFLYELFIPEKKWYTVMSVLDRYHKKCEALGVSRYFDDEVMQKLVDVINESKTNKTIVKKLIKALRHSCRAFGGGEKGSIWEGKIF